MNSSQKTKKMKNSFNIVGKILGLLFLSSPLAFSQTTICLGDDVTVCAGTPVQINNCGGGSNQASNAVILNSPSSVNLSDDSYSAAVNIGFTFNFYGINYTQGAIGSNAIFSFGTSNSSSYCPWSLGGAGTVPNTSTAAMKNTAMLCYSDINPGAGGNIWYQTVGVAPNRKFVVLYANIPTFFETDCNYMAIILYETTNVIEYHIGAKTVATWNGGLAIQGVENNTGSIGTVTPGRNNSQWTATQDGRRFAPVSPTNTSSYTHSQIPYVLVFNATATQQWGNTLGQSFPFNNGTLNIPSAANGTVGYFIAVNGGSCTGLVGAISDTSWVTGVNSSVSATSTPDICTSGAGTVTANPTGGMAPYTFLWPTLSNAVTQTVTGVSGGTYQVKMTDDMGCISTANITVADTPASYTFSSTKVSCPGGSNGTATAAMVPALGNITYQWNDPAMQTTSTATGLAAGTYNCTITSDIGCSNIIPATVTEIPGMVATFTTITDVNCHAANNGVLVVNVVSGTAPYSYSWDNSVSTSNSANDLYTGVHTVTITDDKGCIITATQALTEPEPLKIITLTPDTQICPENDIMLSVTGSGGSTAYTYTWLEGSTVLGTGTTITVDPVTTGTQYRVELTEACGSPMASGTVTITFPTPIVPSIIANKNEDCLIGEFEFINNSANKEEIASTYYDFGDNSNTIELDFDSTSHDYYKVGTYSIYMASTSIYGCVYENTMTDILRVVPNPTAHFFFSDNPASVFETVIKAYNKSTPDVVDWQWSSPSSIPSTSSLENPTFVFPEGEEGKYEVTMIVTSIHGCTDTLTHILSVIDDLLFYAPNTFTPDGDEYNQTWKLFIRGSDIYGFNIKIYNRWGENIWESNDPYMGWDGTYNGQVVPAGQYTWKASMKNLKNDGKSEFTGNVNVLK